MAYSIKYLTQCYFLQITISLLHFAQFFKKDSTHATLFEKRDFVSPDLVV